MARRLIARMAVAAILLGGAVAQRAEAATSLEKRVDRLEKVIRRQNVTIQRLRAQRTALKQELHWAWIVTGESPGTKPSLPDAIAGIVGDLDTAQAAMRRSVLDQIATYPADVGGFNALLNAVCVRTMLGPSGFTCRVDDPPTGITYTFSNP